MRFSSIRTIPSICALGVMVAQLCFILALSYISEKQITTEKIVLFTILPGACAYLIILIAQKKIVEKKIDKLLNELYENNAIDNDLSATTNRNAMEKLEMAIHNWIENRKHELEKTKKLELHRKEYIGNVSHELKTPIFNIQGYISTLLDGGINDPAININYLQRAEKSVDRMISTIADLEAISQLETGQLVLEYERFDLIPLLKDIFEAQEIKAKNKKITLTLKDKSEKAVMVFADKFRIRQVFTNLIVNSIHYGKESGETKVKFSDTGETILVEISDNGIGMAKEHLPRVFERFYRIDKSRSRDQGGTGLGLAIVKHIVEAHNQHIEVMSTEGAGSVFSFTLKKAS